MNKALSLIPSTKKEKTKKKNDELCILTSIRMATTKKEDDKHWQANGERGGLDTVGGNVN
jgi:hypothetical protein